MTVEEMIATYGVTVEMIDAFGFDESTDEMEIAEVFGMIENASITANNSIQAVLKTIPLGDNLLNIDTGAVLAAIKKQEEDERNNTI